MAVYPILAAAAALAPLPVGMTPPKMVQNVAESVPSSVPYAAIADRVLASPVILDATIRRASVLKPAEAPGLAAGRARVFVEAEATALIRGPAGMPVRFTYLADVPLDSRGKAPKLKKARVLLFARTVQGRAGEIQLTAPDAQLPWTPALDALVRGIATEVVAPEAPPRITGIGNAFHVVGSLPGEGETQIFLTTADSRPVSLSILRRPGEQRRWAVALSEIVDEAAAAPARDTLLWYRLACGLPARLPERSLAALGPEEAAAAQDDFAFVRQSLGPCQ